MFGPNGEAEVFATFSHYTVMEFLTSPHVLGTSAFFFSLSAELIESEFAIAVLRQALAAEPAPLAPSADWVLDREAYCLTLGSALAYGSLCYIPVLVDLFLQFLAPSRPHYGRLRAIQERIRLRSDESQAYFVRLLPFSVVDLATGKPDDTGAGILLNLVLLHPGDFLSSYDLIRRLLETTSSRGLLDAKLSAVFFTNVFDFASGRAEKGDATITFSGTVREIYEERKGRSHSIFHKLSSVG
jgi:hypothetical protein